MISTAMMAYVWSYDNGDIGGFVCEACARPEDEPVRGDTYADTPMHCEGCEDLLPFRLTTAGYDYVAENIAEYIVNGSGRGEVVRVWAREFPVALEGVQEFGTRTLVELMRAGLDLREQVDA